MKPKALLDEEKLQRLLNANNPEERNKWALEWKKQGKKVIGMIDYYVPEEIICAAGMLPWKVTGTWQAATPLAVEYRPVNVDVACNHILESLLRGEYDFLDGVVFTDWDDDIRCLYDVFEYLQRIPFTRIIHVPRNNNELAYRYYERSLGRLQTELGEFGQLGISDSSLHLAIQLCGTTRALLRKVYELRKKDIPPLTGEENLKLTTASLVMPKDIFNKELSELLPYLEKRKAPIRQSQLRLLVSSERLDHPGYLQLIERAGALVAMDDIDIGSRQVWTVVENSGSPLYDLAKSYIRRPACPRMTDYEVQIKQVVEWVKEYNIDGVLNFPHMYAYSRLYVVPHFNKILDEAGIPVATFLHEYHLANEGQLMTRIGAFVEMLKK